MFSAEKYFEILKIESQNSVILKIERKISGFNSCLVLPPPPLIIVQMI